MPKQLNNPKSKPLDITKPIQTRGGKKARILDGCILRKGTEPLIAVAVQGGDSNETIYTVDKEGYYFSCRTPSFLNIVNTPEVRVITRWFVTYLNGSTIVFTKEPSYKYLQSAIFSIKKIEFTTVEGEGLDVEE